MPTERRKIIIIAHMPGRQHINNKKEGNNNE
jgi:hypothetical protein